MKLFLLVIILFFITLFANAQRASKEKRVKKDDFKIQIDSINYFLQCYDTLKPNSDGESNIEIISSVQGEITERLLKILNDKRILEYQIENLFKSNDLYITKSDDNKIYFLSIEEKTGGSYRSSITIIHYRLKNGTFKSEYYGGNNEESSIPVFGKPYLIDSLNQKYFMIGGVETCNTCHFSAAMTLQLDSSYCNINTIFQFDGRYDDLEIIEYDTLTKVFSYEFFSSSNDDLLYGDSNIPLGFRKRFIGKFVYHDGDFIQIENCEYLIKKDDE